MRSDQETFTGALEEIIDRLDEARSDALITRDADSLDLEAIELDDDMSANADSIENAVLEYEGRIDELTQVLGEEIDNLRRLLENMEEDR
jgi:hypothetical protein